jgi:hypothetical protein
MISARTYPWEHTVGTTQRWSAYCDVAGSTAATTKHRDTNTFIPKINAIHNDVLQIYIWTISY